MISYMPDALMLNYTFGKPFAILVILIDGFLPAAFGNDVIEHA